MTPGDGSPLSVTWIHSPVGLLRAGASATALRFLEFTDSRHGETQHSVRSPILDQTQSELAEYFAGQRRSFEIPLSFSGTPFQERVWSALRTIGYGQTVSYLEQSRMVADEKAVRAVAQANGQNPLAILIPCHRVVNANGQLGGYGGGQERKQFLLDLERGDRLL